MKPLVVLITGALSGIGQATALAFAKEGARVLVSGRHDDKGRRLVAELRELGGDAEFFRADVRNEEDVRNLVDATVARYGRLDAAVNNAAMEGKAGLITEQSAETYNAVFETNVLGTLLSMKHELRVMLPQGHGSIVNVSSIYGRIGSAGAALYAASKHAVEGLTKSAAIEAASRGVRVNAVAPGPTDKGLQLNRSSSVGAGNGRVVDTVLLNRIGTPEEIAEAILFVASDKAAFITGATLPADGGKAAV